MDMTEAIAPKSDQLNSEDLLTGPRTFTIERVEKGSAEQPANVYLLESPGKPFRPSKTVSRLMVSAWGPDSTAYHGQRITLYRDPSVKFGAMAVGGIRMSHMSGIEKRLVVALTTTRGKKALFTVDVLTDAPKPPPAATGDVWAALTAAGCPQLEQDGFVSNAIGHPVALGDDLTDAEADLVRAELATKAGA